MMKPDKPEEEKPQELDAYSIVEFCRRHSISKGTYYNMKSAGHGPREGHIFGKIIITKESAKDWREHLPAQ